MLRILNLTDPNELNAKFDLRVSFSFTFPKIPQLRYNFSPSQSKVPCNFRVVITEQKKTKISVIFSIHQLTEDANNSTVHS